MTNLLRSKLVGLLSIAIVISAMANDSILDDGLCYRLEIGPTGVYEISGDWLNDNLDIPLGEIDIKSLKIYGIAGGTLNESSNWEETERLTEIPSTAIDEGNGVLDGRDKLLFYAEGASSWKFDPIDRTYDYGLNPYAATAYVILKISTEEHTQVRDTTLSQASNLSTQYLYHAVYHEDKVNLLGASSSNQGSGQEWFGTELSNVAQASLNGMLPVRNVNLQNATLETVFASRSKQTELLSITSQDVTIDKNIGGVNTGDIESIYARKAKINVSFDELSPSQKITLLRQEKDSEAKLWLDYIKIEGRAPISYTGASLTINNIIAAQGGYDGLSVSNASNARVWDVSNPTNPVIMNTHPITGQAITITIDQSKPQEFVVFDPVQTQLQPGSGSAIKNQSISDISDVDMLVIFPEIFRNVSNRFAQHRSSYNNINIYQVAVEEIYNEYAAGRMDPTAIRNYLRDLYRNQVGVKYVLLIGDASYDYRYLLSEFPNENLIPTFETKESLDPLLAFPSDDYYALLDDGENGKLSGDLDIAIGRIIARNQNEANDVVNKIIRYDNAERSAGSWRTRLAFVADDEDNNLHINDADKIAEEVAAEYPLFNQSKIYLDAYVQESTPGGNRYPSATTQLNQTIEQGAMVLNYLGHGGPFGWSQERVLKIDDINNWTNLDRLPLIITATCSFTGFDDPALTTAGEAALLQPNGGGIALFTTVRSVYASKNFRLTQSVFREIFEKEDGLYLPIGEVMRRGKNNIPNDNTNARKFFMIGDPSMRLNIPNYEVTTSLINRKESDSAQAIVDTVGALDLVEMKGEVRNEFGDIAQDFTGVLDITVFDKANLVSTLANDNGSFRKEYRSQDNVIYKGKVAIQDGRWAASFRIPVDINYSFGQAKVSYYALSEDQVEATGFTKQLAIEGSSEQAFNDDNGPEIGLFLNDRTFISGATVGPNNLLIADITDESGLNLSSASIGHKMTAYIDDQPVILNDFFTPSTDMENGGTIKFDISNMPPGPHDIRLQAFDVANNVGMASIDFIVSEAFENTINDAVISPNPTHHTFNIRVNSDIRGDVIEMKVDFYDVLGNLVQTTTKLTSEDENLHSASFRLNRSPNIIMALIRLRDRNTDLETTPIFKKIISLK